MTHDISNKEFEIRNNYNISSNSVVLNDPISYTDYIFENQNFKEYVKYAFVMKRYQSLINRVYSLSFIVSIIIALIVYLLTKKILISVILLVALGILLYIIIKKNDKGETYDSFYNRTIRILVFNILKDYSVSINEPLSLSTEYLSNVVRIKFTEYSISNVKKCANNISNGEIYNLVLKKRTEHTDKDGNKRENVSNVFDGFSLNINYNINFDYLKGAIIEIRDDDNLLSSITEDTAQSIYQSDKEFMFNSESLNKALDCHIMGVNSFGDIDDLMRKINLVITPGFEDRLIFLKERFNSFNLTISDNRINFTVNMNKSFYQKGKSGELLDFTSKYRDKTKNVSLPNPHIKNYEDFMYYNIFPIIEQLYYVKYFDYMIKSVLNMSSDSDANALTYNKNIIEQFENGILAVSNMDYKEFKEKYKEEIMLAYSDSKEL